MLDNLLLAAAPFLGAVLRSTSVRLGQLAEAVDPAGQRIDSMKTEPAPAPVLDDEIEESDYDRIQAVLSARAGR